MESWWRMLGSRIAQSYLCLKNDQCGEQIQRAKQIGRKSVRRLLQLMRQKMTAAPAGVVVTGTGGSRWTRERLGGGIH